MSEVKRKPISQDFVSLSFANVSSISLKLMLSTRGSPSRQSGIFAVSYKLRTFFRLDRCIPLSSPPQRFPRRRVIRRDLLQVLEIRECSFPSSQHRECRSSSVECFDVRRLIKECQGTVGDRLRILSWSVESHSSCGSVADKGRFGRVDDR